MKIRLYGLAVLMLVLSTCAKDSREKLFELRFNNLQFTIPAGLNTFQSYYFPFSPLATNIQPQLDAFNLTAADIGGIYPAYARITALDNNIDLNFIDEVSIRICGINEANCRLEVFYLEPVPFNAGRELRLQPGLADGQSILLDENFKIEVVLRRLRNISPLSIDCSFEFGFEVSR
ncbi:MAG: hypothetical protein NWR67_09280 [Saprospiraceae bacterium]|jgi:hypothetical protein|nr:hypothetical protein [Saprospiraceae bacterium]MDP4821187.1 hypothetical protein [Saprospiraceae bacterium]MDP4999746.1 hypothetical protein [Saprospiraceae bacterium]